MQDKLYGTGRLWSALLFFLLICTVPSSTMMSAEPLPCTIHLDKILQHDDGQFLWYHPRAVVWPDRNGQRHALITLQKHLKISDYYSGLHVMHSDDIGKSWSKPALVPSLDWHTTDKGINIAVCDVTPGYHAPSSKVIAIGAQVRYGKKGEQLEDEPRAHQTAYSVYDTATSTWSHWKLVPVPNKDKFNFARNACSQWLVQNDGTLLIPFYFAHHAKEPFQTTVMSFTFDGSELHYQKHGTELSLNVVRGLCEPSLARFQGKYYLTLRNDKKGYVTVSDDGLNYQPIQPWLFDDGSELGSYNTQQHWLSHSDGLFLVYTRRGANNDHIIRHRAPLFIAEVDTRTLRVRKSSEQVLIPERGGEMGNFGANAVSSDESWVTVSEGLWKDDSRQRGANGTTFIARVKWSKPNHDVK